MSVGQIQSSWQTQRLSGEVAYLAAWAAALTAEEIGDLGRKISGAPCGVHPWLIRPMSLLGCWPLGGFHGESDQDLLGSYPLSPFGSPTWTESPAVVYPCNSQTTRFLPLALAEEPGPAVDSGIFDTAANEVTDTADNTLANTWYAYSAGDILDTVNVGIDDTLGFAIGDTSEQTTVPLTFSCPVIAATGSTNTATLAIGSKTLSAETVIGSLATGTASIIGSTTLSSSTLSLAFDSQVTGISPGAVLQTPPALVSVAGVTLGALQVGAKTLTAGLLSGNLLQSAVDLLTLLSVSPPTLAAAANSVELPVLSGGRDYSTPVASSQLVVLSSNVLPGELRTMTPTLTANLAVSQIDTSRLLSLAPPTLTGELLDLWLELSPGAYVALPSILTAATAGQLATTTTGELRVQASALISELSTTPTTILPGSLLLPAVVLSGTAGSAVSTIQSNLRSSAGASAGQLRASSATVAPGERLLLPSARQGAMIGGPAAISAGTLSLTPAPAEFRMDVYTITVRQQLFFYPGILLLQSLSSNIELQATLSTPPVVVSCDMQTQTAVIDSPLAIVTTILSSELLGDTAQLIASELRLTPGALSTAAAAMFPVIIVRAYYGLYADTPFVATTGSMFE